MKGKLIFEERQTFLGSWMWYLVLSVTTISVVGTIIMGVLSGEQEGYVGAIIATIVTIFVLLILGTSKLVVTIDHHAIYYQYTPFINKEKVITKEDTEEVYVRKYSPISEYGGYGFRFSFRSGRALNISGNMGLQLVMKNGKKLLIGTKKPELLETAVTKLKENWNMNG